MSRTLRILSLLLASCTRLWAQEHLPDAKTLLLLHFNDTLIGTNGQAPTKATSVTFETGVFGKGILIDNADILNYGTANSFIPGEGTIEFWVKPNWNGKDGTLQGTPPQNVTYFFVSMPEALILVRDGAANLRFVLGREDSEAYQAYNLGSWVAGQWHHVAVTWAIPGRMRTYVDGIERISHPSSNKDLIAPLPPTISIGSNGSSGQVNAVIDELRISSVARSANEIAASFVAGLSISGLTAKPASTKVLETWWKTPELVAATPTGTVEIPPLAATWRSSNQDVASVDGTGRITARKAGSATITAALKGFETRVEVTVTRPILQPVHETVHPYLATPAPNSLYVVPVVIMRFLPTLDGINLDVSKAPDFYVLGEIALDRLKRNIHTYDRRIKFILEEGSRFRGYKDPLAHPSIGYKVVDYITVYEQTPPGPVIGRSGDLPLFAPDFHQIFDRFDGKHYVNDLGVKEFWTWTGGLDAGMPSYNPAIHQPEDFRAVAESNMSSPLTGDISNSFRDNTDLPIYGRTYTVYGQNFRRSQAEAVHNHGHQLEAILSYAASLQDGNSDLFWKKFVGQDDKGNFITGRCGWTHMPPNTTRNFDYLNTTLVLSDIEGWTPDNIGNKSFVNVNTWGNLKYPWPDGETDFPQRIESQWYLYWMQNMPGLDNLIQYSSNQMRNWWAFTGDWDASMTAQLGLYGLICSYSIDPTSSSFGASGGTGTINITTGSECVWTATSSADWISIISGSSGGTRNGRILYSVAANTTTNSRTATIDISGRAFTITQAGWIPSRRRP